MVEEVPKEIIIARKLHIKPFNPLPASMTNFSPKFILKLKETFEIQSDNYKLSKEELEKYFKCSVKEQDILFEVFDPKDLGYVDAYEFLITMCLLANGTLLEKAELVFQLYDFDKSGLLSEDEFFQLSVNCMTSLCAMEGKAIPTIHYLEKHCRKLFTKIDKDFNKHISIGEFKTYLMSENKILHALCNVNVTCLEELGEDYGVGDEIKIDEELDEECNPSGLKQCERTCAIKSGYFDFPSVAKDEHGKSEDQNKGKFRSKAE